MQDGAQRPPVVFLVFRDYKLGEGVVATQDDVAAVLALLVEASLSESVHALATRDPG